MIPNGMDPSKLSTPYAKFDPANPKQGIYEDITSHTYHRVLTDVVSNSYLGRLERCPAAARILDEETPSLMFGRALHSFVLEPASFNKEFAVVPDLPVFRKNKNTNDYKAAFADFQASSAGNQVVSRDDFETISEMNNAIMANPRVKELLTGGRREVTVIWQDNAVILPTGDVVEGTGLWCKARPDLIPDSANGVVLDLKTTRNAAPHPFQSSVVSYGYARQGAMILHGLQQVTGIPYDLFAFIAVETDPPYRTEVYALDDQFLKYGYGEFKRLMRIENYCREQNYWPNFTPANLADLHQASFHTMLKPGYLGDGNGPWEKDSEV